MTCISLKCYLNPSSINNNNNSVNFSTSKSIIQFKYLNPNRRPSIIRSSSDDDAAVSGYVPLGDNVPRFPAIMWFALAFSLLLTIFASLIPTISTHPHYHFPFARSDPLGNFCIIEGPETVQDFVKMQANEIQDNIRSRRNRIFLLMEEVRRLRVQQRLKNIKVNESSPVYDEMPDIPSSIPFLPAVTPKTLKQLYLTSFSFISGIILFGGLLAPILELKLGVGGTSYKDFISNLHLPMQLSQVDPIVSSFSGGAVGVISTLMLLEANNVKQQENKRCKYCLGTGYLACARCSSSGVCVNMEPISVSNASDRPLKAPTTRRCLNCSGAGKVMCPTCLCTGMVMASEHDRRIDPFV